MKPKKIICQKKKDSIKIIFDNNEEYIMSAELLRVESPSAEVQGHGYNQKQIIILCPSSSLHQLPKLIIS